MARWALLLGVGLLCACGRIGFEQRSVEPDADASREDAATDVPDTGPPPQDGGMDAAVPDAAVHDGGMDGGMDGGPDDDAGSDEDAGVEPPPDGDFCEAVVALPQHPVIDGVLEPGLSLRRAPREGWRGLRPVPDDQQADYALGYHADGIYVFVEVTDSTRLVSAADDFCHDGVEIYVDADGMFPATPLYDSPGTVQFVISAPPAGNASVADGSRWTNNPPGSLGDWGSADFGAFPTPTGYAVEMLISGDDLGIAGWSPVAGTDIALALSINVAEMVDDPDADCGYRLGQYFNRLSETLVDGWCNFPFCNTDAFCVAPLQP